MTFPLPVWMLYAICVTFYVAVFVFIQNGADILQNKYGFSSTYAGFVMSLPYTISAGMSPVLGFFVDKVGYSASWVALACAGLAAVHASLALTNLSPIIALVSMGVAYRCAWCGAAGGLNVAVCARRRCGPLSRSWCR